MPKNSHYDIIIIGCGLVGGSLALILPDNLSIAIIDAESPMQKQPGYLALNIFSANLLKKFGLWESITGYAKDAVTPIRQMEVSEQQPHSTAPTFTLSSEDIDAPALGYVTSTTAIRETILLRIQSKSNITLYCPARAESIEWPDDGVEKVVVKLNSESEYSTSSTSLSAKLVIMADGGRSSLREQLGFTIQQDTPDNQHHHIVISRIKTPTNSNHKGLAFERLTNEGPIALLPVNHDEYLLVWTMDQTKVTDFLAQSSTELITALQKAYNHKDFTGWQECEINENNYSRKSYPIVCQSVVNPIKTRLVLMGNAAHTVHPVGAQGFNLSLKDAASLSELIYAAQEKQQDIGGERVLKNYWDSRKDDTNFVRYFTQFLINAFSEEKNILLSQKVRALGFQLLNQSSYLKEWILKKTTMSRPSQGANRHEMGFVLKDRASMPSPRPSSELRRPSRQNPSHADSPSSAHYDIIILGNRLVGSTLACTLNSHYRIAIIDKASTPPLPPEDDYQLRINAYNRASETLLKAAGVWQNIPTDRRFAFDKIYATHSGKPRAGIYGAFGGRRNSDEGRGEGKDARSGKSAIDTCAEDNDDFRSELAFSSSLINEPHVGHFIENDLVTHHLHQRIKTLPNVDFIDNTSVVDIISHADHGASIQVITDDQRIFSGKLLAACDGLHSIARNVSGIDVSRHPYYQRCIVGNIFFDGDLDKTAWQCFLSTGPLGLLPLKKGVCSLAWSCDTERAESLLQMDDETFIENLNQAISGRLGKILRVGPRQAFPLIARHAETYIAERTMLLGDAAHTIHPLGGLGANLGFQDVIAVATLLNDPKISSRDIGRRYLLEKYEDSRRRHNALVMQSMTLFNALFYEENTVLGSVLNSLGRLSLDMTNRMTPVKKALFKQAIWMGISPEKIYALFK